MQDTEPYFETLNPSLRVIGKQDLHWIRWKSSRRNVAAAPARKIKLPRKQWKHNDDTVTWIIHSCSASSTESFSRHLRAGRFHSKIHRPAHRLLWNLFLMHRPEFSVTREKHEFLPIPCDFSWVHKLVNNEILSENLRRRQIYMRLFVGY